MRTALSILCYSYRVLKLLRSIWLRNVRLRRKNLRRMPGGFYSRPHLSEFDRLFQPDNTIVASNLQLMKRIYQFQTLESENTGSKTAFLVLDTSAWNKSFQHANSSYLAGDILGADWGYPGIRDYMKLFEDGIDVNRATQ